MSTYNLTVSVWLCNQDGGHNKSIDVEQKRLSGGPKMDPKQGNKPKLQVSGRPQSWREMSRSQICF